MGVRTPPAGSEQPLCFQCWLIMVSWGYRLAVMALSVPKAKREILTSDSLLSLKVHSSGGLCQGPRFSFLLIRCPVASWWLDCIYPVFAFALALSFVFPLVHGGSDCERLWLCDSSALLPPPQEEIPGWYTSPT